MAVVLKIRFAETIARASVEPRKWNYTAAQ